MFSNPLLCHLYRYCCRVFASNGATLRVYGGQHLAVCAPEAIGSQSIQSLVDLEQ
jgi:hypothetical protein